MAGAVNPLQALINSIVDIEHVAIAFLVLILVSGFLRMYVRLYMTKKFGPEDWTMVITLLVSSAHLSMAIAISRISIDLITDHGGNYGANVRLLKASGVTYIVTLIALKISLGFFFLTIFTYQRIQRTIIVIIMVLSAVLGITYFPFGSFTCAQLKGVAGSESTCHLQRPATILFIVFSIVNILGDFAFVFMACAALWSANLPALTKFITIVLLCMGSTGGVASIVRLVIYLTPSTAANFTKQNLDLLRWVVIELGFGVTVTNLALFRPLLYAMLVKVGCSSFFSSNLSLEDEQRVPNRIRETFADFITNR
ncbi:hypothetical protein ANO11243_095940 [Dothideomycetidae sp. 11243]|nr:hypothetical protein ANO11243_095940 [fungal sp. No.11243]